MDMQVTPGFSIYKFSDNEQQSVEQRRNIELGAGRSLKPGSPETAKARPVVLLKQFVWVPARADTISKVIEVVRIN
jgi:hypothetical protein